MIKYDIYKSPSPDRDEEEHFHARAVNVGIVSYESLKEAITYASSATPGDVSLIMDNIISQIKLLLAQGQGIQLGDLGTFTVSIAGPSVTKKRAINATNLRVSNINFRAKRKLIQEINKNAQFESVPIKHHSVEYSCIEIEALLTDYFKDHRYITRKDFERLCGMTRSTAIRRLKSLTSGKYPLLRKEGSHNSSIYIPTIGSFHTSYGGKA